MIEEPSNITLEQTTTEQTDNDLKKTYKLIFEYVFSLYKELYTIDGHKTGSVEYGKCGKLNEFPNICNYLMDIANVVETTLTLKEYYWFHLYFISNNFCFVGIQDNSMKKLELMYKLGKSFIDNQLYPIETYLSLHSEIK